VSKQHNLSVVELLLHSGNQEQNHIQWHYLCLCTAYITSD